MESVGKNETIPNMFFAGPFLKINVEKYYTTYVKQLLNLLH